MRLFFGLLLGKTCVGFWRHATRRQGFAGGLHVGASLFGHITHQKKRLFLTAYVQTGLLSQACLIAGCERKSHYYWLKDPDYAAAFAEAKTMVADVFEEEASRRALGWDETRYTDDGTPYTVRKQSDVLLIVRLKALKPQEYRENAHLEVSGTVTVNIAQKTRDANERIERLRRASTGLLAG